MAFTWRAQATGKPTSQVTAAASGITDTTDTDHDGAPDWQEQLAGSDPQNPDSNNNGALDGEENKLAELAYQEPTLKTAQQESITNDFLQSYGNILRSRIPGVGGSFSPDDLRVDASTKNALGKSVAAQAQQIFESQKSFTKADIIIDDTKTLTAYFNGVGAILEKRFPQELGNMEINAINKLLGNIQKNPADADTIAGDIQEVKGAEYQYRAAMSDLKALGTPSQIADIQIGLLDSLAVFAESLREIGTFSKDPLLGIAGFGNYNRSVGEANIVFSDIKKFLKKNNLTFTASEKGFVVQQYAEKIKQ